MPEIRLDNPSIHAVATLVAELLTEKLKPLLRLAEQTAENTARAALGQKELLSLKDAAGALGTCDATLRNKGLLNDLKSRTHNPAKAHDPNKLNGRRLSKSRNAQWRFHREEVRRFGLRIHRADVNPCGEGDLEIRGA